MSVLAVKMRAIGLLCRWFATAEGFSNNLTATFDSRLRLRHDEAAWAALPENDRARINFGPQLDPERILVKSMRLLSRRCAEMMLEYPDESEEEERSLAEGSLSPNMQLSLRLMLRTKQLLSEVVRRTQRFRSGQE